MEGDHVGLMSPCRRWCVKPETLYGNLAQKLQFEKKNSSKFKDISNNVTRILADVKVFKDKQLNLLRLKVIEYVMISCWKTITIRNKKLF